MPLNEISFDTEARHWLRMPAPDSGTYFEYFVFSGVAKFSDLKGTGSSWERGRVGINADFSNVIPDGKAIRPKHWTVDVHLASIANLHVSNDTGWAVDSFRLPRVENNLGGADVAVPNGRLDIDADVAVRDSDAFIHRLSFHVTMLGEVVDWETTDIIL